MIPLTGQAESDDLAFCGIRLARAVAAGRVVTQILETAPSGHRTEILFRLGPLAAGSLGRPWLWLRPSSFPLKFAQPPEEGRTKEVNARPTPRSLWTQTPRVKNTFLRRVRVAFVKAQRHSWRADAVGDHGFPSVPSLCWRGIANLPLRPPVNWMSVAFILMRAFPMDLDMLAHREIVGISTVKADAQTS